MGGVDGCFFPPLLRFRFAGDVFVLVREREASANGLALPCFVPDSAWGLSSIGLTLLWFVADSLFKRLCLFVLTFGPLGLIPSIGHSASPSVDKEARSMHSPAVLPRLLTEGSEACPFLEFAAVTNLCRFLLAL